MLGLELGIVLGLCSGCGLKLGLGFRLGNRICLVLGSVFGLGNPSTAIFDSMSFHRNPPEKSTPNRNQETYEIQGS